MTDLTEKVKKIGKILERHCFLEDIWEWSALGPVVLATREAYYDQHFGKSTVKPAKPNPISTFLYNNRPYLNIIQRVAGWGALIIGFCELTQGDYAEGSVFTVLGLYLSSASSKEHKVASLKKDLERYTEHRKA